LPAIRGYRFAVGNAIRWITNQIARANSYWHPQQHFESHFQLAILRIPSVPATRPVRSKRQKRSRAAPCKRRWSAWSRGILGIPKKHPFARKKSGIVLRAPRWEHNRIPGVL